MKKAIFSIIFLSLISLSLLHAYEDTSQKDVADDDQEKNRARFRTALSAGYVFKHDDAHFKDVYGLGMANVITGDVSFSPWQSWEVGTKASYWLVKGKTTAFNRKTFLQQVPLTFYMSKMFNMKGCVQWYVSLGGGVTWIKEESYLGHTHQWRGIGEAEFGMSYPVWRCCDLTTAFRYLFPRQKQGSSNADVGGFDLRGGIGYSF